METIIQTRIKDGKQIVATKSIGTTLSTLLGSDIDAKIESESLVNPKNGRFTEYSFKIDQGTTQILISASMVGNTITIDKNLGGGTKKISLVPNGILTDFSLYPQLFEDFKNGKLKSKTYDVLDFMDREFQKNTYTYLRSEPLKLAGKKYETIVLEAVNGRIGSHSLYWLDTHSGMMLKSEIPGRETVTLADESVKTKVRRLDADKLILADAGVSIQDFQSLSYVKVIAVLNPIGMWITPESLNVFGQTFRGTVKNNRIEGIFEISHPRYTGGSPPPFPIDYRSNKDLQQFLIAEDYIEADDPVLIKKAKEVTAESADSWNAAKRLSKWVAESIAYAIPGGTSARNTYDVRKGECGAHSRLFAALCRAVGIPARVVFGCMYAPINGTKGSFAQHAWNEIYMGNAGWIPIDTTAKEIDYCDSGHIRLGVLTSSQAAFNPQQSKIVDFKAGSLTFADAADTSIPPRFQPYIGKYQSLKNSGVLSLAVQNRRLALKLPNGMTLEFRDPDKEGRWYLVMDPSLSLSFAKSDSKKVMGMTLYTRIQISKQKQDNQDLGSIPKEYQPYCGSYLLTGNLSITVLFRDKGLSIKTLDGKVTDLEDPDASGVWKPVDKSDKGWVTFVKERDIVQAAILNMPEDFKKLD